MKRSLKDNKNKKNICRLSLSEQEQIQAVESLQIKTNLARYVCKEVISK